MDIRRAANNSQIDRGFFPDIQRSTTHQASTGVRQTRTRVFIGSNIGFGRSDARQNRTASHEEIESGLMVRGTNFQQHLPALSDHLQTRAVRLQPVPQQNRQYGITLPRLTTRQTQEESTSILTNPGTQQDREPSILRPVTTPFQDEEEKTSSPPSSNASSKRSIPSSRDNSEPVVQVGASEEEDIKNFIFEDNSSRKSSKTSESSDTTKTHPEMSSGERSRTHSTKSAGSYSSKLTGDINRRNSEEGREVVVESSERGPRAFVLPGRVRSTLQHMQQDRKLIQERFDLLSKEVEEVAITFEAVSMTDLDESQAVLKAAYLKLDHLNVQSVREFVKFANAIANRYDKEDIRNEFKTKINQYKDRFYQEFHSVVGKMTAKILQIDELLENKTTQQLDTVRESYMDLIFSSFSYSSSQNTSLGRAVQQKLQAIINKGSSPKQFKSFIEEFEQFHSQVATIL